MRHPGASLVPVRRARPAGLQGSPRWASGVCQPGRKAASPAHRARAPPSLPAPLPRSLEDLPLYGLGVSVGGSFVLKLPQHMKMD